LLAYGLLDFWVYWLARLTAWIGLLAVLSGCMFWLNSWLCGWLSGCWLAGILASWIAGRVAGFAECLAGQD
jgi:hypothetical protein